MTKSTASPVRNPIFFSDVSKTIGRFDQIQSKLTKSIPRCECKQVETTEFTSTFNLFFDGDNAFLSEAPLKAQFEATIKNILNADLEGSETFFNSFIINDVSRKNIKLCGQGKGLCYGTKCKDSFETVTPKTLGESSRKNKKEYFLLSLINSANRLPASKYDLRPKTIQDTSLKYDINFEQRIDYPWSKLTTLTLSGNVVEEKESILCKESQEKCNTQKEIMPSIFNTLEVDYNSSAHECSWEGVVCDESNVVTQLRLENHNNTKKKFPENCTQLHRLTQLILNNNGITGSIPSTLGDVLELKILSLENNAISGKIPTELGLLSDMTHLQLDGNILSGSVPSQIGNVDKLEVFDASRNRDLGGSISSWLGNLRNLRTFMIFDCAFYGSLPTTFNLLKSLKEIILGNNKLTGNIDVLTGLYALQILDLGNNQFSSTIPSTFENLKKLRIVNLYNNKFEGQIPTYLEKFELLEELILAKNDFFGYISTNVGKLTNLVIFDVADNDLTSTLPSEFGTLDKLKTFNCHGNNFRGKIPSELGKLSSLIELVMSGNNLSDLVPIEYGQLYNTTFIDIGFNSLRRTMPTSMNQLSALKELYIWGNNLTGNIGFFCDVPVFKYDLGEFSKECDIRQKKVVANLYNALGQDFNQLDRECDWKGVDCNDNEIVLEINLAGRKLTGSLSDIIGKLHELKFLDLSNNELKGSVPAKLSELLFLESVNLSNNYLTGNAFFLCGVDFEVIVDLDEVSVCSTSPTSTPTITMSSVPTSTPTIIISSVPTLTPTITSSSVPTSTPTITISSFPTSTPTSTPSITSVPTSPVTWEQFGSDINGVEDDNLGRGVSLSHKGNWLLVGGTGVLRIYSRTDRGWLEEQHISSLYDVVYISFSLDEGTFVATDPWWGNKGKALVFYHDESGWKMKGDELLGQKESELFGLGVSINGDGNIIAIGAPYGEGNYVSLFELSNEQWLIINTIVGQENTYFGVSLSITSTADRLVVGASKTSNNGDKTGSAFVYSLFPPSIIQQMNGEGGNDKFGRSVTMSSDGSIIAVGASKDSYVIIYGAEDENSPYQQIGNILRGTKYTGFGSKVVISSNGHRIAVGAGTDDEGGIDSGKAHVYAINNNSHKLIGEFIGQASGDESGYAVSLSGNGKEIAIGAPFNDGGGTNSGHVRVYKSSGI